METKSKKRIKDRRPVLLCGIQTESPIAMVWEQLKAMGVETVFFNQRNFDNMRLKFEVNNGLVTGWLKIGNDTYRLEDFSGVYARLMDDSQLPELAQETPGSARTLQCRQLHSVLYQWIEIAGQRVVNKCGAMASNGSKPYQAQMIRGAGFKIPETLVTTDAEKVLEFNRKHGKVIYKSISGVRSIVQDFEEKDISRLKTLCWCPTQFQQYIDGVNVRVHVIGNKVLATRIEADATDYRYAHHITGNAAQLSAYNLEDEVAEKCVELTKKAGLAFSGIDLKYATNGDIYCFEMNPSPGYSYFENESGQPIARTVAEYLAAYS